MPPGGRDASNEWLVKPYEEKSCRLRTQHQPGSAESVEERLVPAAFGASHRLPDGKYACGEDTETEMTHLQRILSGKR